jgi:hypothetical protein
MISGVLAVTAEVSPPLPANTVSPYAPVGAPPPHQVMMTSGVCRTGYAGIEFHVPRSSLLELAPRFGGLSRSIDSAIHRCDNEYR